jgi:hypothetical protein
MPPRDPDEDDDEDDEEEEDHEDEPPVVREPDKTRAWFPHAESRFDGSRRCVAFA